ncbi:hypothetical protein ACJX0J_002633, partial (mitochondrion) [Zea mays]
MFGSYLPLNGIVDLVTFVWYFSVLFFKAATLLAKEKEGIGLTGPGTRDGNSVLLERLFSKPCETMRVTMTFASECYKLVVVIALLRISIWEVRWKTGAFKSRLFLPIWDTPPSHDNHSASGLLLLQELLHNLRSRQN